MQVDLNRSVARLLDWAVPEARMAYTRRDTALYALSVGAGHDPHDEHELALVDPWSARFAALPSMALVLGYPGFWLGSEEVREATGLESTQVLHVEQSFEIHAPLPVEAEVVGRTRVTGLVDKASGRGCLLYSERMIRRVSDEALLATCRQVHYLRGADGGGHASFEVPARRGTPDKAPDMTVSLSTRPEQALLYRLNGDANSLHIDPAAARRAGFARPILHGMCTVGVVTRAIVGALAGNAAARLKHVELRMTEPVLPGESISVDIWGDGAFRARSIESGKVVVADGRAVIA